MTSRAVLCLSLPGAAPALAAPGEVVRLPSGLGNPGVGELEHTRGALFAEVAAFIGGLP